MKNKADFNSILETCIIMPAWNPNAKFLVYLDVYLINWNDIVQYIFRRFWKYLVSKVTVFVRTSHLENKVGT